MGREQKIDAYKIAIILMSFKIIISSATKLITIPNAIDNIMILASVLFSLMDFIAYRKYSFRKIKIIVLLGLLCCYTSYKTSDSNLLINFFFIICCMNHDFYKILKIINRTKIMTVIGCTFMAVISSLFWNPIMTITKNGTTTAYCFGFSHSNVFAEIVLWCIIEYTFLKIIDRKTVKLKNLILPFVIGLFVSQICVCRSAMIALVMWYIGIILSKKEKLPTHILQTITKLIIPVIGIAYVLLVLLYANRGVGSEIAKYLNVIFSGRIGITAKIYETSGISLLGKYVQRGSVAWDSYYLLNTITIDGLYSSFMIQIGMVYLLGVSIFNWISSKFYSGIECIAIIIYAVYGITEVGMLNGYYGFPLFLIIYYTIKNRDFLYNYKQRNLERYNK